MYIKQLVRVVCVGFITCIFPDAWSTKRKIKKSIIQRSAVTIWFTNSYCLLMECVTVQVHGSSNVLQCRYMGQAMCYSAGTWV
jgi:hypothetical protein